jgi:hypothetical protein
MKILLVGAALALSVTACESLYENNGDISRITSQRQVDAYNATVSSEGEKLVCSRERSTTSNISRFTCMTVNQQERLALQAREEIDFIRSNQNGGNN